MKTANRSLNKIWRDFKRQPAHMSDAEIEKAEEISRQFESARRVVFASLGRSGLQLIESAEELAGAKAWAAAIVYVKRYETYLKELTQLATSAHTRLSLALCERPDMAELLTQAQHEYVGEVRSGQLAGPAGRAS